MTESTAKLITCQVESIYPFGVFVRAGDNRYYIRRRELTLSGNIDPRAVVTVGETLQAVRLAAGPGERTPELSVRAALGDPWGEFARGHRPGDVVAATVKHLFADGVLVEVIPGVDGYIPARELAAENRPIKPDYLFWPGDRLEAIILRLDLPGHRLSLSLRRRIEQLLRAESLKEQFDRLAREPAGPAARPEETAPPLPDVARIDLAGPILVVEDRADIRQPLITWLEEHGCRAYGAGSGDEAVQLCATHDFVFGLFDLDIPGMNGAATIQRLRKLGNNMAIAVMSGPDLIAAQWPTLQPLGIVACFAKPMNKEDELTQTLLQVGRGEAFPLPLDQPGQGIGADIAVFHDLSAALQEEAQTTGRLKSIVSRLVKDTRADKGIIFQLAPTSGGVAVITEAGHLQLDPAAIYSLPDSPIMDVVSVSRHFLEGHTSRDHPGRWQKLKNLLPFESVLAVPLPAGGRTEHALFLFTLWPEAFSRPDFHQAQNAAYLLQAVLEGRLLEQRLQANAGVLLSGQLSSAFGHEVYNKVQSLDLEMSNLARRIRQLESAGAPANMAAALSQVKESTAGTAQTVVELRKTVLTFQQMMRTTTEKGIDVNEVLLATEAQVRLIALRGEAHIDLDLAPALPQAQGNSVHAQQVFLNLMLNAIQQLAEMDVRRRRLHVSTRRLPDPAGSRLHIRFADTGPGIHRSLWEKIFALGFTTREGGSGLGLFIARSLIQSMGGQISIEESLVPTGTTFLVDLPAMPVRP